MTPARTLPALEAQAARGTSSPRPTAAPPIKGDVRTVIYRATRVAVRRARAERQAAAAFRCFDRLGLKASVTASKA
jgi:hypothetical protein